MRQSVLLTIIALLLDAGIILAAAGFSDVHVLMPPDSVPVDTLVDGTGVIPRYTFQAVDSDFHKALKAFGRSNGLRVRTETVIDDPLTVSFDNETFEVAMQKLLAGTNLSWRIENNILWEGS